MKLVFDESYNGNILVNAFSLGLVKQDEIFLGLQRGLETLLCMLVQRLGEMDLVGLL